MPTHILSPSILVLIALLSGCATTHTTSGSDAPSEVALKVDNELPPASSLHGKKVRVSFKNSPKLAAIFAERMERAGAVVVGDGQNADVTVNIEGRFAALREYGGRKAKADLGEMFEENGGKVESHSHQLSMPLATGGKSFTFGQATAIVGVADAVGDLTGVKGKINMALSGDPDGFCYRGCEYQQGAVIEIEALDHTQNRLGTARFAATAIDRRLVPIPLAETALEAALDAYSLGNN